MCVRLCHLQRQASRQNSPTSTDWCGWGCSSFESSFTVGRAEPPVISPPGASGPKAQMGCSLRLKQSPWFQSLTAPGWVAWASGAPGHEYLIFDKEALIFPAEKSACLFSNGCLASFFLLENESEIVGPSRGRPARKMDAKPDKVEGAVCLSQNAWHLLAPSTADIACRCFRELTCAQTET